jgi:hypothetical protein
VLAVGTGLYLLTLDGEGIDCPSGPGACPETYETTTAGFGMIVTGAALGAGATWMFLEDRRPGARRVSLVPARGGVVLGLSGSF